MKNLALIFSSTFTIFLVAVSINTLNLTPVQASIEEEGYDEKIEFCSDGKAVIKCRVEENKSCDVSSQEPCG